MDWINTRAVGSLLLEKHSAERPTTDALSAYQYDVCLIAICWQSVYDMLSSEVSSAVQFLS